MTTSVYFATNRRLTGDPALWTSYGDDINAALQYGVAAVDGTDLALEGSGTITGITEPQAGDLSAAAKAAILGSNRNLLVFALRSAIRPVPCRGRRQSDDTAGARVP